MQTKIIQWDFDAWEDYLYWQTQDKKMLKKINQLVKEQDCILQCVVFEKM